MYADWWKYELGEQTIGTAYEFTTWNIYNHDKQEVIVTLDVASNRQVACDNEPTYGIEFAMFSGKEVD